MTYIEGGGGYWGRSLTMTYIEGGGLGYVIDHDLYRGGGYWGRLLTMTYIEGAGLLG